MTTFETPTPTVDPAKTDETPKLHGLIAEFETPGEVLKAAAKVREAGYRWWDCCTPFPVHGLDGAMGIKPTILPVMVFFAGLTGLIAAFILQAFTNSTGMSIWSANLASSSALLATATVIPPRAAAPAIEMAVKRRPTRPAVS